MHHLQCHRSLKHIPSATSLYPKKCHSIAALTIFQANLLITRRMITSSLSNSFTIIRSQCYGFFYASSTRSYPIAIRQGEPLHITYYNQTNGKLKCWKETIASQKPENQNCYGNYTLIKIHKLRRNKSRVKNISQKDT